MARERKNPIIREGAIKEPAKVYALALEGRVTEVEYFNGIIESRKKIGIAKRIHIKLLEREKGDENKSHPKHIIEQIKKYCEKEGYDSEEICLIIDRDEQNFKKYQYDEILEECLVNKYNMFVSNPTFELWLLMHFDFDFSKESLLLIKENRKIDGKYRYLATKTSEKLERSKKSKNVHFEKLINGIDLAIENSSKLEQNITELKDKIGTNIGQLIMEMKR